MANTRPDRSAKLKNRSAVCETVVKCCLRGKLLGDQDQKTKLIEAIESRVQSCSEKTAYASVALNYLIKEIFDGKDDLRHVELPAFWDQTFIRQLFLGVKDAVKPYPEIKAFFERHPEMLCDSQRYTGDRNIYSFASKKLQTNVKNHLVLNFQKVLKTYLYDLSGLRKDDALQALFLINGWEYKEQRGYTDTRGRKDNDTTKKKRIIRIPDIQAIKFTTLEIRSLLGLEDGDVLNKQWFKDEDNLHKMLKLFVFVSRKLDDLNNDSEDVKMKSFNLLPICGLKSHFITMDTSCLYGIMKDVGMLGKKVNQAEFQSLGSDQWMSILKIESVRVKSKTFTGTIETDGVSVCLHFTRPKTEAEQRPTNKASTQPKVCLKGKRVLGVDPGRTNILQVVEELPDGTFQTWKLTRSSYYRDSGVFQAAKESQRWNRQIKNQLESLSMASPKGASLESFKRYIETWLKVKEAVFKEYNKKKWKEQRMRLYGGKKRVFANFLNRIDREGVETVLAFGSAKFAPGGKGELSVPTTRAFKECSYRFKTITVDEFRTTRVYYKDGSLLEGVGILNKGKVVKVRGLLWCCSTKCNEFVNRDLNAAINILRCGVLPQRPTFLDRKASKGKLPNMVIRKILTC